MPNLFGTNCGFGFCRRFIREDMMRTLFEMDKKNYDSSGKVFYRPSVRSIIIRGGRVAMVHSLMYDYYKFPGGGIESGETRHQALIRETAEESGLCVVPDSIQAYGCVRRIEKSDKPGISVFVQNNFYYFCEAEPEPGAQKLDDYEARERFTLEFVEAEHAIDVNRNRAHGPKNQTMLEREARVLEMLREEGYLD